MDKNGRSADAVSYYVKSALVRPRYFRDFMNLAVQRAGEGRRAEAMEFLNVSAQRPEPSAGWLIELGGVAVRCGLLDQAADFYRRSLELDPKSATAHNDLGALLAREGKVTEAIGEFQEALKLSPGYATAQRNLAGARRLRAR